jgi:hypothetical protein
MQAARWRSNELIRGSTALCFSHQLLTDVFAFFQVSEGGMRDVGFLQADSLQSARVACFGGKPTKKMALSKKKCR